MLGWEVSPHAQVGEDWLGAHQLIKAQRIPSLTGQLMLRIEQTLTQHTLCLLRLAAIQTTIKVMLLGTLDRRERSPLGVTETGTVLAPLLPNGVDGELVVLDLDLMGGHMHPLCHVELGRCRFTQTRNLGQL